ncbi:LytR/AlgR family response regulator transcription factor [Pedobacter sp. BG31]|uniref:LytR/AlgR family response regulator transcription factor n=1 Tax=Pedobacter sp. BG31 TaxID=3349697 RepID=UPI0035F49E84
MKINCLVVDDDPDAIEEITEYIKRVPYLELKKSFSNPIEVPSFLRSDQSIDMVFMDVDMPELSGIDLSKIIRPITRTLIFTTSHARYAIDAFATDADGFLLKPFNFTKFLATVEKVVRKTDILADRGNNDPQEDYIFVKNKEDNLKLVKIRIAEIVAVESMLNYVRIYLGNKTVVTHLSLKDAKQLLADYSHIVQLHRSFLISVPHIETIDANNLTMSNGSRFTIGENYRPLLMDLLNKKSLRPIQKK